MRNLKSVLAVLGAAVILVLAANTVSIAATGQALLLGKSNSANANTSITRTTSGSVLKLKSALSSNSPLTVNGKGKVTNLNADQVDGLSGSALQNRIIRYRIPASSGSNAYTWHLAGLPSGTYMATYSVYTLTAISNGQCWLRKPVGSAFKLVANAAIGSTTASWNASGVVTTAEVSDLHCQGSGNFTVNTQAAGPTEVTFTRIDHVTPGSSSLLP
jgi:hypothetical protein